MAKAITQSLTLSGRYFSKKELFQIQQTVRLFSKLSLTELAQTVCDHLDWVTPKGQNKINSCLVALEKLEALGYVQLPQKRQQKKRETKKITASERTEQGESIHCSLEALGSIELRLVNEKAEVDLYNEYVERYHYLGYKHPVGAALKYFIVSKQEEKILGCLMFSSAVWHLSDRDQWIGWNKMDREKRLNRVINNNRFLIFPWVDVYNLASKVLSMSTKRVADDWQETHGYRPVLIETFVDSSQYSGTCYQAANWQCIGQTTGKNWSQEPEDKQGSIKSIFVYPMQPNFKAILNDQKPHNEQIKMDEQFVSLWGKVVDIIAQVAQEYDKTWQKRPRVIDTHLLVYLINLQVFSKNRHCY